MYCPSGDHATSLSCTPDVAVRFRVMPVLAGTVHTSPRAPKAIRLPSGASEKVPIDLEASVAQHREVLDESAAYTRRLPAFFYIDFTATYRTNHKKFSGIWAIQVRNLLNQRPVTGYVYNDYNQTVDEVKSLGIIPLISYKIEF